MKYFSLKEFTSSSIAKKNKIDNTPTPEVEGHIINLVENLLDPLREAWTEYCKKNKYANPALTISSGYRCPALNTAAKGVATSAHLTGYAADVIPSNKRIKEFIEFTQNWIKDKKFDQCINEYGQWCHIGYKNNSNLQRKQIFRIG